MGSSARSTTLIAFSVVISVGALLLGRAQRQTVNELHVRVDSLAVAVSHMLARGDGRSGERGGADTLTVAMGGVAIGAADAPVTVVEFTDYQCPFCGKHARETMPELNVEYIFTGRVRYVVRDLPLPMHPMARPAALATRCVSTRGAGPFEQFRAALFANQLRLGDSLFTASARSVGISRAELSSCMQSDATRRLIEADIREAARLGISSTPLLVIGHTRPDSIRGVVLRGAYRVEHFRSAIDALLGRPEDSDSTFRRAGS
jgi:protein-disulfide isomerase